MSNPYLQSVIHTIFASHLCGAGEPTSGRTVSGRGDISVDQIENAQTWAHNDVDNSRHRHQIIAGKTCKRLKWVKRLNVTSVKRWETLVLLFGSA